MLHHTVCPRKKSPFRNDTIVAKCALLCLWEFKLASQLKFVLTYLNCVYSSSKFPRAISNCMNAIAGTYRETSG